MTVAAIDIGSNSVRLLVVDEDGSEIARVTTVTALGMGLEETGSFDAGAYGATIEAITRNASTIAEFDVADVRAVAASASRDARNGAVLMEDIGRLLGVTGDHRRRTRSQPCICGSNTDAWGIRGAVRDRCRGWVNRVRVRCRLSPV